MLPSEIEFKQEGDLGGEKVNMVFDEDSLGFLSGILIDLYSDREKAVIREYATNARDSHIEAGTQRPIEITTPTYLSYYYKIKDWGVGMSADDIRSIYSKYGASTKRETNAQSGMLGLGCKSALAYTDQFTIMSVKDGKRIYVAVTRTEDGGGAMTILDETDTYEPNGVEISVPVSRTNDFERKAQQFFQYWNDGEVLINGRKPEKIALTKITDRIFLKDNSYLRDSPVVVMGGVPYTVDKEQIKLPNNLVVFVEIGEVDFQPSREYLKYTARTKASLTAIEAEYLKEIKVTIQKDIDDEQTRFGAYTRYKSWANRLRGDNVVLDPSELTFQGHALEPKFDFDAMWRPTYGYTNYPGDVKNIPFDTVGRSTIVYGYDRDDITTYQKQKLKLWAEENNKPVLFYFVKDYPSSWWLEESNRVSWDDILAIKISRGGTRSKGAGAFECFVDGVMKSDTDFVKTRPILYSTKKQWNDITNKGARLPYALKHVQYVFVGENRLKKFLKAYPTAKTLYKGLNDLLTSYKDNLTPEDKRLIKVNQYESKKYQQLDASKIKDPQLVKFITMAGQFTKVSEKQHEWDAMCDLSYYVGISGMRDAVEDDVDVKTDWIVERYPLIEKVLNTSNYWDSPGQKYWDHVHDYLNSVYEKGV